MDAIRTYRVESEGGEYEYRAWSDDEARELARAWLRQGDYGACAGTIWPGAWLTGTAAGEERVWVAIDPVEPACRAPAHAWDHATACRHGPGVILAETCARCGSRRETDTGATDPDTGTDGLRAVRYYPAESVGA